MSTSRKVLLFNVTLSEPAHLIPNTELDRLVRDVNTEIYLMRNCKNYELELLQLGINQHRNSHEINYETGDVVARPHPFVLEIMKLEDNGFMEIDAHKIRILQKTKYNLVNVIWISYNPAKKQFYKMFEV